MYHLTAHIHFNIDSCSHLLNWSITVLWCNLYLLKSSRGDPWSYLVEGGWVIYRLIMNHLTVHIHFNIDMCSHLLNWSITVLWCSVISIYQRAWWSFHNQQKQTFRKSRHCLEWLGKALVPLRLVKEHFTDRHLTCAKEGEPMILSFCIFFVCWPNICRLNVFQPEEVEPKLCRQKSVLMLYL